MCLCCSGCKEEGVEEGVGVGVCVVGVDSCLARRGVEGAGLGSKEVREGIGCSGQQWKGTKFGFSFEGLGYDLRSGLALGV